MSAKKVLGQYFTTKDLWLKPQVEDFIQQSGCTTAYDPFAGNGDLLQAVCGIGQIASMIGMDIDPKLNWKINDSLQAIPHLENAIIITNPPYLAKYSAKRRQIHQEVENYYTASGFVDVYQLAIYNCLLISEFVVAIIPETFINSGLSYMNRLNQITVLEENPFHDTENPVCVVCFDNRIKDFDDIKVFKNEQYVCRMGDLERHRLEPRHNIYLKFNQLDGQIALRGVDSPNPNNPICFMRKEELDYNLSYIKPSSRLISLIAVDKHYTPYLDEIILEANCILAKYRKDTNDLILSPFKGNQKNGIRRRRLDYKSARAILEMAINNVVSHDYYRRIDHEQKARIDCIG